MTDTTATERPAGWFDQPSDATPEQLYAMDRTMSEVVRRSQAILESAMDAETKASPKSLKADERGRELWEAGWRSAVTSVAYSLLITFDQMASSIDGKDPQTERLLVEIATASPNLTVELIGLTKEQS